jgi:catechol 2,3-dioxygenase-like lactoylglutathione lyase family enzyme
MSVSAIATQIRTTNLNESIDFYVAGLGFELDFRFEDFYAGIRVAEGQIFHLKLVDEQDPSIDFVRTGGHLHLFLSSDDIEADAERCRRNGVKFHQAIAQTPWGTKEFYVFDNQGHMLCFAQDGSS